MIPLEGHRKQILDHLMRDGLKNSLIRDISTILPFILEPEEWFTSISLRKRMYNDKSFTRKELARVSSALYNIYHNTQLLLRKEKRKLYFHHYHKRHISHWAYQLNKDYLLELVPYSITEELAKLREEFNLE